MKFHTRLLSTLSAIAFSVFLLNTQAGNVATVSGTILLAALLGIGFFAYRSRGERNSASL